MKMLPYGRLVPVHCCCDPNKRLGWVPAKEAPGPVTFVLGRPRRSLWDGTVTQPETFTTEIAYLVNFGAVLGDAHRFLAVKSNDLPIEKWRLIPGFIEDTRPR